MPSGEGGDHGERLARLEEWKGEAKITLTNHEADIRDLKNWRAFIVGAATTVGLAIGALVRNIGDWFRHVS